MFQSSKQEGWTTLDEYITRMQTNQKDIFYISGENKMSLMKSPQMESFIKNNIEVLFFTDPVDEFWLPNIDKFNDVKFKSITKGNVDLNNENEEKNKKDETKEDF